MKPLISIVIPTYNRARDLERALKSVLTQTYPHWEALIIDNHSSDNTTDVVAGLNEPRAKLFKIHNHGVIAASRNLGIRHSAGKYIAFLDSDDWWMPQKLKESLKYLEQGADLVYHDLFQSRMENQKFFLRKVSGRALRSPVFADLIRHGNPMANSGVVVRKCILDAIGGLSEDKNLIAIEDFDAWLRTAKVTEKLNKIPKTLGYYWAGGGNISNPKRSIQMLNAFQERYAHELENLTVDGGPWWINYAKARAHYLLHEFTCMEENLGRLHWREIPLPITIKIQWMRLITILFRKPVVQQERK